MSGAGEIGQPPARVSSALRRHPGAIVLLTLLALFALAALFAPAIAPQNPYDLASLDILDSELPPVWLDGGSWTYPLGTDAQGRDLLSAVLYGLRVSMLVGVLAVVIQAAIGIPLGMLAGYSGGRADTLVTRFADIQLSLSTLMLAIVALALFRTWLGADSLGANAVPILVVVIGLAEWPFFARTARAGVMSEKAKDYVRAARALGATDAAIIRRHIFPNILSPLIIVAAIGIANAIMAEAALSFLGLGMPPTRPSLGTLIRSGYDLIFAGAWWVTLIPGAVLVALLLTINLLGDSLRDALDPRLQDRGGSVTV
ncbi:Dipeptide transport system permease protein DppC [Methyloligella halotolerans]|uniref:Dipeptide transport system permease protein DppC n=1 Tax=Methyloligella halotolerans TaxID=1177755 RepID=A0A1E2S3B4_9HYPH|nr:ABC transporter permease [Methyloligella halotolerans]ODA68934.1 Dipeptide transport system permease protein DppC [Methyloligella halotolerans]